MDDSKFLCTQENRVRGAQVEYAEYPEYTRRTPGVLGVHSENSENTRRTLGELGVHSEYGRSTVGVRGVHLHFPGVQPEYKKYIAFVEGFGVPCR